METGGDRDGKEKNHPPLPHVKDSDKALQSHILFPTRGAELLSLRPMTESLRMLLTVQGKGHRVTNTASYQDFKS